MVVNLDNLNELIEKKTFSIIMPVYNNKSDVINAIKSIISQTCDKWELIIIDDCSTDGTYEFIKNYLDLNICKNKIKLLKNFRNFGSYVCMNIGIINSNGEYITRIDSDDLFEKNKLKKQAAVLDDNDNNVACLTKQIRLTTIKFGEVTLAFKRFIISKIGFYDNVRFAADSEFLDRIHKIYGKARINYIDEVLYYYIPRENSLTTSTNTGLKNNGNKIRFRYKFNYFNWHSENKNLYIPFDLDNLNTEYFEKNRPFPIPDQVMLP